MELDKSIFDIDINLEKNILTSKIKLNIEVDIEVEYAFYLFLNKQKIDIRYFSKDNIAQFLLTHDGEYSVKGFVRHNEQKIINTSDIIKYKYDKENTIQYFNISIFGSCVSRDIFEFDKLNRFNINTYIARQSIVSAVSKPIECNIENIKLKSKFQREAVYNDFKKNIFEKFKNDKSEYLLIDLIDERFKILRYKYKGIKSIVTYSASLQESDYIEKIVYIPKKRWGFANKKYYIGFKKLEIYLDKFCKRILAIYEPEKIIIHRCKMCNYYTNSKGAISRFPLNYIKNNRSVNELLNYMYDYLEKRIPEAKVIDISDNYYADENHKWGLSPMHYQKEYYQDVLKELNKLEN
ncbi:DUF6270 domain-containing protein [Clostridium sp. ZBS4]|uniref:DUF6270 domain-containing protein n=1 Tax=Clostridium sp. ZBS4 TaxID=2949974 RepID=UPI002079F761|nr:DUF6270 domain-containing protein [Clostridium sp. ZBS4]